jgi:hypothetical protein
LKNPAAVRHLNRTLEEPAATNFHTLRSCVDVADVEVENPGRDRHRTRLGNHAADGLLSGGKKLIGPHRAHLGFRFLPAKKRAIKSQSLLSVRGEQLVPTNAAWHIQLGLQPLVRSQPTD